MSTGNDPTGSTSDVVPGKVTTADLPPCRVCGENASGFHYGVNTCEACKGFFRRCLVRNVSENCRSKNRCAIIPGQRHAYCAPCRYKKCLSVGMSKTAIKTGRYTQEKRTQNIEEVQEIRKKVKIEVDQDMQKHRAKREALDQLIEEITANHMAHLPDSTFCDSFQTKEKEFLEEHNLKQQIIGDTSTLSAEEYRQIYDSTGIDIDGRREWMAKMVPRFEKSIMRFINFCKGLPGFKDLPTDDQIAIIKAARNHTEILRWSHLMSRDVDVFYSPHVDAFTHMTDYKKMLPEYHGALDKIMNLVERAQDLELTPEEQAVFASLAVMNTPIGLTHIGWMIRDEWVDKLGDALYQLLEKRTEQPGVTFGKLLHILIEMETLDEEHLAYMEGSVFTNFPGAVSPDDAALLLEMTGLHDLAKESYQRGKQEIISDLNVVSLHDQYQQEGQGLQDVIKNS